VYLTGTLGFGDYNLGSEKISVLKDDPFLFKLDANGTLINQLVLPINTAPSKGVSIALNTANEITWIGKYSGKNAILNGTFLPHEADFTFQQHTFILTIDQSEDLQITAINTIASLGTYEIPEIIPIRDSIFLAAGYFSQDILLGDTSFMADFSVSNRYDGFIGTFSLVDTNKTNVDPVTKMTKLIAQTINIFPNPTATFLNLQLEQSIEGQLTLKSFSGQTVYTANFKGIHHQVSVANLPKGIYFVYLESEQKYLVQKVMIQ